MPVRAEVQQLDGSQNHGQSRGWTLLFAAWLVAFGSSMAVLFIGEVMGQAPCNLCWFQRASMFPLAVILGVACIHSDTSVWRFAAPVAGLGWLTAAFHTLVFWGVVPKAIEPCGRGPSCASADMTILGQLPLPVLSLLAFSAILILLHYSRHRRPQ